MSAENEIFCLPVHYFILGIFIEAVVKSKVLVFKILGKVHFEFRFMYDNILLVGYSDDIRVLPC